MFTILCGPHCPHHVLLPGCTRTISNPPTPKTTSRLCVHWCRLFQSASLRLQPFLSRISVYLSQSLAESSSINMAKQAVFVTRPCGCVGDKMKVDKATCNLHPWIVGFATPRFLQVTSVTVLRSDGCVMAVLYLVVHPT